MIIQNYTEAYKRKRGMPIHNVEMEEVEHTDPDATFNDDGINKIETSGKANVCTDVEMRE